MKEPTDGGPAFPFTWAGQEGMSLRDWFAGQALPGLIGLMAVATKIPDDVEQVTAKAAYALADAMLKEREIPPAGEGEEPKQQQSPTHAENHPVVP